MRTRSDDRRWIGESLPDIVAHFLPGKFPRGFFQFLAKFLVGFRAARETDHGHAGRQFAIGRDVVERGNQFAMVRSPVAPKITTVHGCGTARVVSPSRSGFAVDHRSLMFEIRWSLAKMDHRSYDGHRLSVHDSLVMTISSCRTMAAETARQFAHLAADVLRELPDHRGRSSASAIRSAISSISSSFIPRVVTAGVPMRMPPGLKIG